MVNKCENCGECCIRTEMILSQQDVDLIIKNFPKKIKRKDFLFKNKKGFLQLKNSANHCVFLDFFSKKCMIYEYRPQGCKFYPLIYDVTQNICTFDKDCPRLNLFYQDKQEFKKNCKRLKNFLKIELHLTIK